MTDQSRIESDRTIESVFDHAVVRPEPPDRTEVEVRSFVMAEWRSQVQRRRRLTIVNWALAASVALAAYVGFDLLRSTPSAPPEIVARIDFSQGPVTVVDDQVHRTPDPDGALLSGQTIQTPGDAALALAWVSGGSLRIGAESRVRLLATNEVELQRGMLYFDSEGSTSNTALTASP